MINPAWRGAFTAHDTNPLVLGSILLKMFGPEYLAWEPETIGREVQLELNATVSEINRNRIEALRCLYTSDTPGSAWREFAVVANGLDGIAPRTDVWQPCSVLAAARALTCGTELRGDTYFQPEVLRFCAALLHDDGYVLATGPFQRASVFLPDLPPAQRLQVAALVRRGVDITRDTEHHVQAGRVIDLQRALAEEQENLVAQLTQLGLR